MTTETWRAGLARTIITPQTTQWLSGYTGVRQAAGKRHDLWVKALALEDAACHHAVVVTSDLIGLSKPMYDRLSVRIQDEFGLDRAQVMLTGSHNHCAPVTGDTLVDYYPLEPEDWRVVDAYTAWVEERIVETIREALDDLAPATLSAGEGEAGFAVNRRNNREAEVSDLLARGEALRGPVDHRVPTLAVRRPAGELRAVVFGYACHPTTLSDDRWCGDYPGYAQIALERAHPGAQAMFWTGCGGDQNPLPRRSAALCERYGEELAGGVEAALRGPQRAIAPELRTALAFVTLDFERTPTRAEIEADARADNTLRARWARRTLERLDAGQPLETGHPYAVQVWRLGAEQLWIALGAEAVVDYALRFRREYGPETWVAGYAHDMAAYIPSRRVWDEGGYEGGHLYEYGWPAYRWAGDVEERIAAAVARLVEEVQRSTAL